MLPPRTPTGSPGRRTSFECPTRIAAVSIDLDADAPVIRSIVFTTTDGQSLVFPSGMSPPPAPAGCAAVPVLLLTLAHPFEYLVVLRGCNGAGGGIAGLQFQTNVGRTSPWIGSKVARRRFEFIVEGPTAGFAIVGVEFANGVVAGVVPGPTRLPKRIAPPLVLTLRSTGARPAIAKPAEKASGSRGAADDAMRKLITDVFAQTAARLSTGSIELETPVSARKLKLPSSKSPEEPVPAEFAITYVSTDAWPEFSVPTSHGVLQRFDDWGFADAPGMDLVAAAVLGNKALLRGLFEPAKAGAGGGGAGSSLAALVLSPNHALGEAALAELVMTPMQSDASTCVALECLAARFVHDVAVGVVQPSLLALYVSSGVLRGLLAPPAPVLPSLVRRLLTPTRAHGRPALAELMCKRDPATNRSLLSTLSVREPDSLLRHMLARPRFASSCLLEPLVPILDRLLRGEDGPDETCLLRDALTRRYAVWGGQLTLAEAGLAGEAEWGLSMMRVLVAGDGSGDSVLRLLIENDESRLGSSALSVLVDGYQQFLDAHNATSTITSIETYYTAVRAVRSGLRRIETADAQFKSRWNRQWLVAAARVRAAASESSAVSGLPLVAPAL